MIPLRLAIIVGSTRPGRRSPAVAEWVLALASERADIKAEERGTRTRSTFPFYDEPVPPMSASKGTRTRRRGRRRSRRSTPTCS